MNELETIIKDLKQSLEAVKKYPEGGVITMSPQDAQALLNAIEDRWIPVSDKDKWPPIDQTVLVYYTIQSKKDFFEYLLFARIQSITENASGKYADWVDSDYNTVNPTHWQPSPPTPPKG